jgi:hypothetical protein
LIQKSEISCSARTLLGHPRGFSEPPDFSNFARMAVPLRYVDKGSVVVQAQFTHAAAIAPKARTTAKTIDSTGSYRRLREIIITAPD